MPFTLNAQCVRLNWWARDLCTLPHVMSESAVFADRTISNKYEKIIINYRNYALCAQSFKSPSGSVSSEARVVKMCSDRRELSFVSTIMKSWVHLCFQRVAGNNLHLICVAVFFFNDLSKSQRIFRNKYFKAPITILIIRTQANCAESKRSSRMESHRCDCIVGLEPAV